MTQNINCTLSQENIINSSIAQIGPQGIPGEAATITIGSVTTGAAGSSATVTNSGTSSDAILDFVIPQGATGEKGATGERGAAATVSIGSVTGGAAGTVPEVSNSGTLYDAVLNFVIPKGDTGAAGQDGTNAVITGATASVDDLVGIPSVTVTAGGTESSRSFDFAFHNLKGETGDTGANGQDGADGFSPTATVTKSGDTATITITDKNGTTTAQVQDGGVNSSLSNLSTTGESRLHALKSYLDEGELLTDSEGLADVKNYAHSSFDVSKFTKSSGWSGTITSDGIASGFGSSSYLTTNLNFGSREFRLIIPFRVSNNTVNQYLLSSTYARFDVVYISSSSKMHPRMWVNDGTNSWYIRPAQYGIQTNTDYIAEFIYNSETYLSQVKLYSSDGNLLDSVSNTNTNHTVMPNSELTVDICKDASNITTDLKQFSFSVDGVTVFSGHETGTDTYTINGNTVTIPYTLSKTGSKIADASQRTNITALYNQQGYAPYYTLDEVNGNFTLPMGEVYGMMSRKITNDIIPDYANAITISAASYTAPSDGYLFVIYMVNSSDASSTVTIDGAAAGGGAPLNFGISDLLPIGKGSVAAFTYITTKKFIPMKGV